MPPVATEQEKPASDPRTSGFMTKLMSKAFGRMTPDERTEMMQDAAALTSAELGKADNLMTVDSAHTGYIEDHWSTGKPQDIVQIDGAHGPGSSSPSGSVNVGPSQEAAGNGATRMEPQYSRYAPQSGLQTATEKLGRDVLGIKGAMKSILKAMEGFGTQLEMLKAGAAPVALPDTDAVQKMIETAVAKAMEPVRVEFQTIVSKAWDKKDKDDDKEDDEEAKSAALLAKADDKEKDKERAEENDEKSASATAAAELRLMAKARITHAKLRLSKALDYAAEEKAKAAQRAMTFATINLAKAQSHLDESTALLGGKVGLSTQSLALDIAKAKKGLAAAETANQDIWPATTEAQDSFGKAKTADPPPAAAETAKAPPVPNPDLAKAVAQIEAAATGMGMMTASVADLFKALSGQTKPVEATTSDGERHNMPPVFALAKAGASDLATREAELARLRDSNVISFEDHDHARDALTRARMGLPEDTIKAMIARLPEAAKAVLTRSAA